MKRSIIDRSTICFDHLATPLQHTVDQSLYATLIQVGPGPLSAKCAGIPPKRYRPSPSCWLSAWCYTRGSRWGCSRGILQQSEDLARSPDCIPLWRNSSAFCRGPGPIATWINVAYKLWSTVCWWRGDRSRWWTHGRTGPISYAQLPEYVIYCLPEIQVVLPEYYMILFLPEYGYMNNYRGPPPPPPASYAYGWSY